MTNFTDNAQTHLRRAFELILLFASFFPGIFRGVKVHVPSASHSSYCRVGNRDTQFCCGVVDPLAHERRVNLVFKTSSSFLPCLCFEAFPNLFPLFVCAQRGDLSHRHSENDGEELRCPRLRCELLGLGGSATRQLMPKRGGRHRPRAGGQALE